MAGGTGQHFLRAGAFRRIVPGRVARHRDRLPASARVGRSRALRPTTLWALWACWLCMVSPVHAEPLRAVLRVSEAADGSLLTRVRGQTGDLDVVLEGVPQPALEPSFGAQLEAARALAAEHVARVVLWAARDRGGLRLVVVDFALDRVLVRELGLGEPSALDRSAQEEAAALVARSALRASLAGSALGSPAQELVPEPEPEPAKPEPEPEPPPEPVPVPAPAPAPVLAKALPPPTRAPVDPEAELGVLSGIDGASEPGHHMLTLRAGVRWRRLELAALGGVGVPVAVSASLAKLTLALHRVEASAGVRVLARAGWALSPALGAGVLVVRLRGEARDPRLSAEDARGATTLLTAFLRLDYRRGPLGLALRVGLDVLPSPPELGYRADTGFVRVHQLWTVQPHLGLSLLAF
jgi:hypothetical protein